MTKSAENNSEVSSKLNVSNYATSPPSSQPQVSNVSLIAESSTQKEDRDKTDAIVAEMVKTVENVDELRAQVRQLQSQLENISDFGFVEPAAVDPVSSVNAFSMGIPKEDLDYAEIEECTGFVEKHSNFEETRKKSTNSQKNHTAHNFSGYKKISKKSPLKKQTNEENDYDEILPRPTNFHVVQQVGSDTLLIGWNYVNPSILDGFEVYLNNKVHERIYIPDRTKALISGLDLRKPICLSIYALSQYGQMSEPAVLEITPYRNSATYFKDETFDYKNEIKTETDQHRPYSMEW